MNKAEREILENYLKDADFCAALDNKKYGRLFQLTDEEDLHLLIEALEDEGEPVPKEEIARLFSNYEEYILDNDYSWDTFFDLFMGFPYEQQYDLRDYKWSRQFVDVAVANLHHDRVFDLVTTYADSSDKPYILSVSARIIENDELVIYAYVIGEKGEELAELKHVLPTYKYFKGIPHVGYGFNSQKLQSAIRAKFKQIENYL